MTQNTAEWLKFRKKRIGASDAPIIMGISPWKTPFQLWEEKLDKREPVVTSAMQKGTEMEEEARQTFEKETGITVFPVVVKHPEFEWMIASLDGMDIEGKHIVEIKYAGKEDHLTAIGNSVPEHYYPQLQHQLAVTGLEKAFYFSYNRSATALVTVERDDEYISSMLEKEKEFYKCMKEEIPPKLTERDFVQMTQPEWHTLSKSYLETKRQLEYFEEQEREIRERLLILSGRSNALGGGIKLTKVVRKGPIEYQKVPQLEKVDLEPFRKPPIETWRIVAA